MSEDQVSTMEAEALKRKERLKALKSSSKSRQEGQDGAEAGGDGATADKKPKFRSYKPADETILENATVAVPQPVNLEDAVQSQLELLKQPVVIEEIGIANLAPRKPDWDLKRDVAKKLERLEHRTQRAIAELIRERLRTNGANLPMLEGVNMVGAGGGGVSKVMQSVTATAGEEED